MAKNSTTVAKVTTVAKAARVMKTLKVTNVQRKMTPEQQQAWKDANGFSKFPADVQAGINAKLAAPLTIRGEGKKDKAAGPVVINDETVKTMTLMGLLSAKTVLTKELALIDAEIPTRTDEKQKQAEEIKARMAADAAALAQMGV